MKWLWIRFKLVASDESGTEVLEWGLVAALIVVGAIAAISLIGPKVKSIWEHANSAIPSP